MIVEGTIDVRSLPLDDCELWRCMGCRNGESPDDMTRLLTSEVKAELFVIAQPKYSYTISDAIDFRCGKIIAKALSQGERFAIVIATLGKEVDALLYHYKESDIVKAFIADLVASELAELTSRAAIAVVASTLERGETISNAYSPGYCGWALTEQRKLFAYFGDAPSGVTLTDSCLMLPIKSVSSVLAIGHRVEKLPYGCEICEKTDCYKKIDRQL